VYKLLIATLLVKIYTVPLNPNQPTNQPYTVVIDRHSLFYDNLVSDIAIFVLKRDVKLQLTNFYDNLGKPAPEWLNQSGF